jgi:hypothetical protein
MSHTQVERHPFLDDLTADAELISSTLRVALAVNGMKGQSAP